MTSRYAGHLSASERRAIEEEAREELRQSKELLKELNQRLDNAFKTRYFGDRCLDQLSSLLRPTLSGAPRGVPKPLSASAAERGGLVETSPHTERILERYHDVEVQGNSVYIAVARLITHLLSPMVDTPLPEKTNDPEMFLHICFPNSFHEFWGIRCPAWQKWPEATITSEDVLELFNHNAQPSPLLGITDRPAVLIDLMNHPSLAPTRETLVQAGQVAIIDTTAMQRLGVRYGRSALMADHYPSRAEGSAHLYQANQQASLSFAADQGNGKRMTSEKACRRNDSAENRAPTS